MYFSLLPQRAYLSDSNRDLVETYQTIKKEARAVADRLRRFSFTNSCYYRVRGSNPKSSVGKAARFIYLNRTCWNGLYRVNREGKFNVPMGSFDSPPDFLVTDRLMSAQRVLRSATILCQDFETAIESAKRGDTVYLDPPYTVAHNNNGFLRYNDLVFSWSDQRRLAVAAKKLRERGCKVILNNADHPSITELYHDFVITKLQRKSLV
jgi:DNA adenine methylase